MIVLDYIKSSYNGSIVVPPFHTGHLGFIPNTEVSIGLMAPQDPMPSHCEVVISPFHQDSQRARIACTMRDEIGVVGRLVDAISSLGINIVTLESSAINHLNHHAVNILVEMSTTSEPAKESTIRHYARYEAIFPTHDQRYVLLFESIAAHCADKIVFADVCGRRLPELRIIPLGNPQLKWRQATKIRAASDDDIDTEPGEAGARRRKAYHVAIDMPPNISNAVRKCVRTSSSAPLSYILLSDTEERNLRVFFPTPETANRLIHIGFYHDDLPGVLAEITDAVARSRFNVLTSLLRKVTEQVNMWEAVLEYKGDVPMPASMTGADICGWVAEVLRKNSKSLRRLVSSNVEVGLPLYPRRKGSWSGKVSLDQPGTPAGVDVGPKPTLMDLLCQRAQAAQIGPILSPQQSHLLELVGLIRRRLEEGLPTVFLSYPGNASHHAHLLKESLKDYYRIVEYQTADGEVTLDEVRRRIVDSDYFIGLWHHDERLPTELGRFGISPWMPFEYGIAFDASKRALVVHSEKLDEKVWNRINPAVTGLGYSDLYFCSHLLPKISAYCRKNFV